MVEQDVEGDQVRYVQGDLSMYQLAKDKTLRQFKPPERYGKLLFFFFSLFAVEVLDEY